MKYLKKKGVIKEVEHNQKNNEAGQNAFDFQTTITQYVSEIEKINSELTHAKVKVVHKNETLIKLKEEVETLIKNSSDLNYAKHLRKLLNILDTELGENDSWENFVLNFDKSHNDFLQRIKNSYPHLSPKDLKLCAYLRMNMSSKEIAPLLNISVRGVEIGRYRIRKKVGLENYQNLNEFMMTF